MCHQRHTRSAQTVPLAFCLLILAACGEHATGPSPASVASVSVSSGDNQTAFAGTVVPASILIAALDASGNRVSGQTASFSVTAGGGSLSASTARSGPDGFIAVPAWTLGKTNIGQEVGVVVGNATTTIKAAVRSDYQVDLQFFGAELTQDQQAIFTGAVNRIRAIVVGSVPPVDVSGVGAAPCGLAEIPAATGIVQGLRIYATARSLDGINGLLGYSKVCNVRPGSDMRTTIGLVVLDMADINYVPADMRLVALHEMVHLLGFGNFIWNDKGLLTAYNTPAVAYTGAGGIAGCKLAGGDRVCSTGVPVQGDNSHWRDSVFGPELMTSNFNGTPALSVMTIKALEDLGYLVNVAAADPYTVPTTAIQNDIVAPTDPRFPAGLRRAEPAKARK